MVTITNESGVYDYDAKKDVMDTVDFLIEHGASYSVYSQEEIWLEELRRDPWTVI